MRKSQLFGALILLLIGLTLLFYIPLEDHKKGEYTILIRVNVDSYTLSVSLRTRLGDSDGTLITNKTIYMKGNTNFTLTIMGLDSYARKPGNKIWAYIYLYADGTPISLGNIEARLIGSNGIDEEMIVSVEGSHAYVYKTVRVNVYLAFVSFLVIIVVWALLSLSPIVVALLIPILGMLVVNLSAYDILSVFWDPSVALIFGALVLAYSMHKSGLAERITYIILSRARSPTQVLIYLTLISYLLSMWMSSLGTMIVMLPIIGTVLKTMNAREGSHYARGLTLSTMFAAIFGGSATIVGNPANALVASITYRVVGVGIGFLEWMIVAVPITLIALLLLDLFLLKVFSISKDVDGGFIVFDSNAHLLFSAHLMGFGPWKREEKITFAVLLAVILLWMLYSVLYVLGFTYYMQFVAFSLVAALVLIASNVIDRKDLLNIRWDVLLVLGGSLSLYVILSEAGILDIMLGEISKANPFIVLPLLFVFVVMLSIILGPLVSVAIGIPLLISVMPSLVTTIIIIFGLASSGILIGPNGMILEENVRERGFLKYEDFVKWGLLGTLVIIGLLVAVWLPLIMY